MAEKTVSLPLTNPTAMANKQLLSEEDIKQLIKPMGSCIASSRITCDGQKVGFMYRDQPEFEIDCGWRFLSGDESEDYLEHSDNAKVYDVNTIANYDPAIIPFLKMPVGTELEREGDTFVPVEDL